MTLHHNTCPICENKLNEETRYCLKCGFPINLDYTHPVDLKNYPFRNQGPRKTLFPDLPQTLWKISELNQIENSSLIEQEYNPILWTLPIKLNPGQYDLALVSLDEKQSTKAWFFLSTKNEPIGEMDSILLGEDIPSNQCIRFSLLDSGDEIRLGIYFNIGIVAEQFTLLLIPRLGLTFYAQYLPHDMFEEDGWGWVDYGCLHNNQSWGVKARDFRDNFLIYGPHIPLNYGDYIAIVRFSCENWVAEHEPILSIELFSSFEGQQPRIGQETLAKVNINSKDIRRAGFMQEISIPFQLDPILVGENEIANWYRKVECRIRTIHPADIEIDCIRICKPEDRIDERYYELGGKDSILGSALGAAFVAATSHEGTRGWLKRFETGMIYWASWSSKDLSGEIEQNKYKYDACEIFGHIAYHYELMGGSFSILGFPRTRPRKVTSHYGTDGVVQRFEGYRGYGTIYAANFSWGTEAHAVFGGIADGTYFNTQDAHRGAFGFPISDEFTVGEKNETEWIRRSEFEGGEIDWHEIPNNGGKIWCEKALTFYPHPKISKTKFPQFVYLGDLISLGVEVDNLGGPAEEGYITFSFPDPINEDQAIVAESSGKYTIARAGEACHGNYGHNGYTLKYARIEAHIRNWQSNSKEFLDATITPGAIGKFRIQIRTTMCSRRYKALDYKYDADPSPISDEPVDQQNEHVYTWEVDVRERPEPKLDIQIIPRKGQNLILGSSDYLSIEIQNTGSGDALQVIVTSDVEFGAKTSKVVPVLKAGQSTLIRINNIRPVIPGNVTSTFVTTYQDEFGKSYEVIKEVDFRIFTTKDEVLDTPDIELGPEFISPLKKRLIIKNKEFAAISEELSICTSPSQKVRLDEQLKLLEKEIKRVEYQLNNLLGE